MLWFFFKAREGLDKGTISPPLLFVMCMEYLTRPLLVVRNKTQFKFHPRYSGVRLNHLCFTSDIILYSKGDFVSVYSMLRGFKHFYEVSGL